MESSSLSCLVELVLSVSPCLSFSNQFCYYAEFKCQQHLLDCSHKKSTNFTNFECGLHQNLQVTRSIFKVVLLIRCLNFPRYVRIALEKEKAGN